MKSERRHELEKNELAAWLNTAIEKIRPYSTAILGGVLMVAIVVLAVRWWGVISQQKSGDAWGSYFNAFYSGEPAPSEYDKIAEQYPATTVGQVAQLTAADVRTAMACDQLFTQKSLGQQELRRAVDDYLKVLQHASNDMIQQRATFGLARSKEALGDVDDALANYEKVVKTWPEGVYTGWAKQRIDDLKRRSSREFYDKFAKAERKPASKPSAIPGADLPAFDYNSLSEPKPGSSVAPPPMKLDQTPANDVKTGTGLKPAGEKASAAPAPKTEAPAAKAEAPAKPAATPPSTPPADKPADAKK